MEKLKTEQAGHNLSQSKPDNKGQIRLFWSESVLSTLLAQYLLAQSNQKVCLMFRTALWACPQDNVASPIHYIAQMYGFQLDHKTSAAPNRTKDSVLRHGYKLLRRLASKLIVSHDFKQMLKKRFLEPQKREQPSCSHQLYREASFLPINYEAIWKRFLQGKVEEYYKPFLFKCELKWCRSPGMHRALKGDLIVADYAQVHQILPEHFYCLMCDQTTHLEDWAFKKAGNVFLLFDSVHTQDQAINKYSDIKACSWVVPPLVIHSGMKVLTNTDYIHSLIQAHSLGDVSTNTKNKIIWLDLPLDDAEREAVLVALCPLANKYKSLSVQFVTHLEEGANSQWCNQHSHISCLQSLRPQQVQAILQRSAVYCALSTTPSSHVRALYAGYFNVPILAKDEKSFRASFRNHIMYCNTVDTSSIDNGLEKLLQNDSNCQNLQSILEKQFSLNAIEHEFSCEVLAKYHLWRQRTFV